MSTTASNEAISFPVLAGETVKKHEARKYKEAVEHNLAAEGLLVVYRGHLPAEAEAIVDVTELPTLDVNHRDFQRRQEYNLKATPT